MGSDTGGKVQIWGPGQGEELVFRGGAAVLRKVTSDQTGGRWAFGEGHNMPGFHNTPHTHTEPEAFYVVEGTYTFYTEAEDREVGPGDLVFIPPHTRHGFVAGPNGGRLLCLWPAAFDGYFHEMIKVLEEGEASPEVMDEIAQRHGQRNLPFSRSPG